MFAQPPPVPVNLKNLNHWPGIMMGRVHPLKTTLQIQVANERLTMLSLGLGATARRLPDSRLRIGDVYSNLTRD